MVKTNHRAYERPEAELLDFILESNFLLSVTSNGNDPVGGAAEGDTDDWGWN